MKYKIFVLALVFLALSISAYANPTLLPIGNKVINEGQLLSFNFSAIYNNTNITTSNVTAFSNTSSPAIKGAVLTKLNESTANFAWTPSYTDSGTYSVTFSVQENSTDGAQSWNSSDSKTMTITVNNVPASLSSSTLTIGGTSQQRSNPKTDKSQDENILVESSSFTVTNTGTEPITGLNITSFSPSGYSASALNFTIVSVIPADINNSQSSTFVVKSRIPENLPAVDSSLVPKSFSVGSLTVKGSTATGGQISLNVPITMQAKNNLRIKDVNVIVDGDSENVNDGDTVKDVRPGAKITVEVIVENKFTKDDNLDIQDVEVRINNDDLDVSEDDSAGDVKPKKTKSSVLRFDVDKDADEDDYEIVVEAEGEDENGAKHGEKIKFTLEVTREDHEISVSSIVINPESVTCEESAEILVNMKNTGSNDEEDIFLRFESPDLNFNSNVGPIQMDQDKTKSYRTTITLPKNLSTGSKRVNVMTYYDGDQLSKKEVGVIKVNGCSGSTGSNQNPSPANPPAQNPVVVIQPPVQVVNPPAAPSQPVVAQPTPESALGSQFRFTDSPYYIPVLIIANLLILVVAIFLVSKMIVGSSE